MDFVLAAGLVLASFAGTALIYLAISQTRKRRAAIREMAQTRGWRFSHTESSGGSGSRTVISDPAEGWEVTLYFRSNTAQGGSTSSWSHFDAPGLALDSGLAVLGPEIPQQAQAMANSMLDLMGGSIVQVVLNKMTGGLGAEMAELQSVPGNGPGTLFATPGRETALDAVRLAPELAQAREGRNDAQQPIVILGPMGLRLRYTYLLRRPEEVEGFITLGRALSARLR